MRVLRKVSVIGVSGNGKTTFSRRLAALLGAPAVELDSLVHQAGWRQASDEEVRAAVRDVMAKHDRWVIDGSYVKKLGELVFDSADTVVWLDLPLPLVMTRLVKRALKDIVTQRDLFNGNRQTLSYAFFVKDSLVGYAFKEYFRRRRETPRYFAERPHLAPKLVRLRSPRAVERFLAEANAAR